MEINVIKKITREDGWVFRVEIDDGGSRTSHEVTVQKEYYTKLTGGSITPEEFVRKSFMFLLKRESKESILKHFELSVIQKYFPEYEQVIKLLTAKI